MQEVARLEAEAAAPSSPAPTSPSANPTELRRLLGEAEHAQGEAMERAGELEEAYAVQQQQVFQLEDGLAQMQSYFETHRQLTANLTGLIHGTCAVDTLVAQRNPPVSSMP
mmetsp:Transcript_28296/g.93946  ORF Transcript_28296/g.93946 Transcript_28296/m.93946 type:complete len:111 (-) Transcript_28296:110-442(-)